jgi:hypothetical protein
LWGTWPHRVTADLEKSQSLERFRLSVALDRLRRLSLQIQILDSLNVRLVDAQ